MSDKVNLVRVLTAATGNGVTISLGAAYSQLFMTPAEASAVTGRTYTWLIVDGNNWELVKGPYDASGPSMNRTTVLASRSGGALGTSRISLSGTAQVRIIEAAQDMDSLRGTRQFGLTADTINNTDQGYAIVYTNDSPVAVSIGQAGAALQYLDGWCCWIKVTGAGTVTITPVASTINGGASIALAHNIGAFIWSDGTNYHAYMMPLTKPLLAANNLSDVANAAAALTSLGGVGYSGVQSLTAAQKAQGRANIDVLKKNYVINGAMMVSQENGSTAGTITSYYPVDQFRVENSSGGVVSSAQVASVAPSGSPNRIRVTVTTPSATVAAGNYVHVLTPIEGMRVADLRAGSASAKTITIQFGVKAPAGTYAVSLRNGAVSRSYAAEFTVAAGEANNDVVKSVTLQFDTTGSWNVDNAAGVYLGWTLVSGSTFQAPAGAWAAGNYFGTANVSNFLATNGNVFELFDVGMYEGAVAPSFMVPDFPSELAVCKRYYETLIATTIGFFSSGAGQTLYITIPSYEKRATPTCAVKTAPSNNNCSINIGGTSSKDIRLDIISTANGPCYSIGGVYYLNARM